MVGAMTWADKLVVVLGILLVWSVVVAMMFARKDDDRT
jgi:hypothetical protein